ncbi:MAG TPA: organomercurial lyase [Candidatus Limnocylindria bacterium]
MSEEIDARVRRSIATYIRIRGAIPTIAQAASDLGEDVWEIQASFERLAAAHVFIPHRTSAEIYAYNPFCVGPTAFRVEAAGRSWWAICGWDALGIPGALGAPGEVRTSCPDCGEDLVVRVEADGRASASTAVVFRVDVPARDFWNDIRFT